MDKTMIQILQLLGKRAAQITTLKLTDPIGEVANFELLRTLCPNLTKLSLGATGVTDKELAQIGIGCPNLTSIDLHYCRGITDKGVLDLVKGCKKLEAINLEGSSMTDEGVKTIADNCPQLASLNLKGCICEDRAIILYVAKSCPSLRYLQVPKNVSRESILDLLDSYPQVTGMNPESNIECYRGVLSYIPVSPLGKLVSAILHRRPREDILDLLNKQDARFDKERFLTLVRTHKDVPVVSLYDFSYAMIIDSILTHVIDLAIEDVKKDRILELFCELSNMVFKKLDQQKLIKAAVQFNCVCFADALDLSSIT